MLVKDTRTLGPIRAADDSELREILHPERDAVGLRYSLAHAVVGPGRTTLHHRLATSEVYYVLSGAGVMHLDGEEEEVHAGQAIYIPPGSVQWLENTGPADLVFLCIVDPAWSEEDEEVIE